MSIAIRAIYEGGKLRPLEPLNLEEHAVVTIALETTVEETERREWLNQSSKTLMAIWNNEADDVYNVLLSK